MTHFHVFFGFAMVLMVFSLFVLWVWTGPVGIVAAAVTTHFLLRLCERQKDGQMALARKEREAELRRAFNGDRTP